MLKRWWHLATGMIMVLLTVVGFFLQNAYSELKETTDRSIENSRKAEVIDTHIEYIKAAVDEILKELKEIDKGNG